MIVLVKSILSVDPDKALIVLNDIIENKAILANQEQLVFDYIKDKYDSLHCFPTEKAFIDKFPEYEIQLRSSEALQDNDLVFYKKEYIESHRRINISRRLLSLAESVRDKGLSYDQVDDLRQYVLVNKEESVEEKYSELELYENSLKYSSGFKLYIPEIDNLIGGIEKGCVTTIAGYAGSGKSLFASNVAVKSARDGKHVVYISLEMTRRDLLFNMWSLWSGESRFSNPHISHDRIRKGKLSEEEKKYLFDVVVKDFNENVKKNLTILDEADLGSFSESEIRQMLYDIDDGHKIDIVVVDHVGLTKYYSKTSKSSSAGEEINKYVSIFRKLAINFRNDNGERRSIAVILLSQTNRSGWLKACRSGGRYTQNSLSESNELERASSVILTVFSSPELFLSHEAMVCLLKSRFGAVMTDPISVFADPEYCSFGERSVLSSDTLDDSMYDSLLGISPTDVGMSSEQKPISLDDFDI